MMMIFYQLKTNYYNMNVIEECYYTVYFSYIDLKFYINTTFRTQIVNAFNLTDKDVPTDISNIVLITVSLIAMFVIAAIILLLTIFYNSY